MDNLLDFAITAHGGLNRWNDFRTINIAASIRGGIWHIKSVPDILKDIKIELETKAEKLAMSFPGQDKSTMFTPGLVTVKSSGNVKDFKNPEEEFAGQTLLTPWQDVHVAYFSGEALWTYLTTPFLYTYPGFITEEIAPWQENGETWRRLKVTFPNYIASHTKEQISYFGPDGLLRRHDYTVDILGGATGANYAMNYRNVDGIIIPATRKVYAYEGHNHDVIRDPLLVSIEMASIILT
jgi:hypothetical protein